MKSTGMLLWILGTTLLAVFAGVRSWGEFQREEGVLSFLEVRGPGPMDPMRQARVAGASNADAAIGPAAVAEAAIAAHQDSHFQEPKRVAIGDLIELRTLGHTQSYRITGLSVVDPDAVHSLDDAGEPALTLVTCYPFDFSGSTPQRFIVRAVAADILM